MQERIVERFDTVTNLVARLAIGAVEYRRPMKCPNCNASIDDGRVICPKCDHILDPSAFDNEPRPSKPKVRSSAPSGVKKSPVKKKQVVAEADPTPPRPARKRSAAPEVEPEREEEQTPPPKARAKVKAKKDDASDWRSRVAREDLEEAQAPRREEKFVADRGLRAEDLSKDAEGFFRSLNTSDKIVLSGCAGIVFSCFMPWKITAENGPVVGLLSAGFFVFVLAGVAISMVYARVKRLNDPDKPLRPWIGQFGSIAFALTLTVIYTLLAIDSTPSESSFSFEPVWASKPSIGIVLSLAGGGVALFGTITGMKESAPK